MRIVFLTTRSWFAFVVLVRLKADGIGIHAVVIEDPPVVSRIGAAARDLTAPALAALVVRKVRAFLVREERFAWERFDTYRSLCGRMHVVQDSNSPACEELLKSLAPDVVILGRCRILEKRIIDVPPLGVLNAHPGWLPAYRGLDTIEWAVLNGDDPGVTIHYVDQGVDTGPIVAREKLPLLRHDTMRTLYARAAALSGKLLSGVLARLIGGQEIATLPQRREEGERFRSMPRRLRRETERALARRVSGLPGAGAEKSG